MVFFKEIQSSNILLAFFLLRSAWYWYLVLRPSLKSLKVKVKKWIIVMSKVRERENDKKIKRGGTHTRPPSLWEGPPRSAQTGCCWPWGQRGSGYAWSWRRRGRRQAGSRACGCGWLPWRRHRPKLWSAGPAVPAKLPGWVMGWLHSNVVNPNRSRSSPVTALSRGTCRRQSRKKQVSIRRAI